MASSVCAGATGMQAFLDDVRARIGEVLRPSAGARGSDGGVLGEAARHLCLNFSEKCARPRLIELVGSALGAAPRKLRDAAVAVELIHSASLLHDDVIDLGKERRGKPTVNVVWGNTVAVLSGDYLLTAALAQLTPHGSTIVSRAVDTVAEMTRSMLLEAECEGRIDTSLTDWRTIAEGKTAALFAFACFACAHLADRHDLAPALERCGVHLGLAFQLGDDLKDVLRADPGKTLLADLRQRRPSYPLIVAAERSSELAARIRGAWARPQMDEKELAELAAAVLATGAATECVDAIRAELGAAREELASLRGAVPPALLAGWIDSMLDKVRREAP